MARISIYPCLRCHPGDLCERHSVGLNEAPDLDAETALIESIEEELARGEGPDRYPPLVRDRFGRVVDVG